MIRFVPWSEVGTIEVSPGDNVVEVGAFELAEGADTLWVRMTNTGTPGPWPWSYGILSFKTDEGQPLGSIKAYNSFDGEVFRLGVGLTPSVRSGVLTFEPRGFNMAWIKQGNPWSLKFEAQSGGGTAVTGYWNRDAVDRVLSPATAGDDVALGDGDLSATNGKFGSIVSAGDGGGKGFTGGSIDEEGLGQFTRGTDSYSRVIINSTKNGKRFGIGVGDDINAGVGGLNSYLWADGTATFQGQLFTPNVQLRSSDPAFYSTDGYSGPQLDLLTEIERLERLVAHLYGVLRLDPPAGWPVWDGSDDVVSSLGIVAESD